MVEPDQVEKPKRPALFLEGFTQRTKDGLIREAKAYPAALSRYLLSILAGLTPEERHLAYGAGQAKISRLAASGMDRDAAQEAAFGFSDPESGAEPRSAAGNGPEQEPWRLP